VLKYYRDLIDRNGGTDWTDPSKGANAFIPLVNWYELLVLLLYKKVVDGTIFRESFSSDMALDQDKMRPLVIGNRRELFDLMVWV
jgi:hypothetical protein